MKPQELKTHTFFSFFSQEQAERLATEAQLHTYNKGTILFHEGDAPDALYLILSGTVSIEKNVPNITSRVSIVESSANDCIGEFGIIDGKPRNATAVISSPTATIALLPYDTIYPVLHHPDQHQSNLQLFSYILDKIRKNNAEYVEQLVKQAQMVALGEMSGAIIHDLRNPLAIIQIATEIIGKSTSNEHGEREHCNSILQQVKRIAHMADDVLDFTKGVALQLNCSTFSIKEFLEQYVLTNRMYLEKYNVLLSIDCEDYSIHADRERLVRVIQNLINNSIDAFAGKPGHISILARENEGQSVLIVGDNGKGIPESILSTLFDPFVTQGKKGGTGLGMAIAHTIVEAHHGTITAENMPGQGCAFTIIFPCDDPKA